MFYFANICPSFCHLKSTNLRLTASSKMCEEVGSSNIHQQFEIMSFCIKEYGNETDLVETRKKKLKPSQQKSSRRKQTESW